MIRMPHKATNNFGLTGYSALFMITIPLVSIGAHSKYQKPITIKETEARGVCDTIRVYADKMCIKEIPFFIALFKCFYEDQRLQTRQELILEKDTILYLKEYATKTLGMTDLENSLICKLQQLTLYKTSENRYNKKLCNFFAVVDSGAYEIPKTGAKLIVPGSLKGSIYYNKRSPIKKITVYLHTAGIRLELPGYAKTISLGFISDMDIGIAELENCDDTWVTRLLYVKKKNNPKKTGWSFNITECKKIRPYSR